MKRPERKEWDGEEQCGRGIYETGYNQALDDMDAWLPSEKEIRKILTDMCQAVYVMETGKPEYVIESEETAKAIHRRIGG